MAEPVATSLSAVRSGIVMFVVPFVFAFYPELLLINEARLDPQASGGNAYLPGYDADIHLVAMFLLLGRLLVALYLLSSALAAFDRRALPAWEIGLRLGLAVMLMMKLELIWIGAAVVIALLLVLHNRSAAHAKTA